MPNRFPFASHSNDNDVPLQEMDPDDMPAKQRLRRSSLLRKPLSLWRRHHVTEEDASSQTAPTELAHIPEYYTRRASLPDAVQNVAKRSAIPSLPRPQTFRRQESEKRERLLEVEPSQHERRAMSVDRRRGRGVGDSAEMLFLSAPDFNHSDLVHLSEGERRSELPPLQIPSNLDAEPIAEIENRQEDVIETSSLQEEHDRRWILNLSMHFRDKSNREKFFVTYAERPNQWRRLTISLDYRSAPADSLEADICSLHYQRDKSMRIYEAIRDSLPDIQYYDTVTNLKLETTTDDGQLHVHVREDANEIIEYPAIALFQHIDCPRFNESQLLFDSHLSGFVYKVRLADRILIKKEIPGPDTVDEFLYEVNALDSLRDSEHVVRLEGLVTDDRGELIKGLLISYASQGALVDMIYDFRGSPALPWSRREKWAKQIVNGLADIHEAGFVQGDFTLSNIVIDEDDNAQIIDINRRGCPVGWESPELGRLINSGQRISMCIGVKTDLFQLGMVLWALAEEVDEPERVEKPLPVDELDSIPSYFKDIIRTCLNRRPQGRKSAVQLLERFPPSAGEGLWRPMPMSQQSACSDSSAGGRPAKRYIDPDMAVTIDDVRDSRRPELVSRPFDANAVTYVNPDSALTSADYRLESTGSWVDISSRTRSRGRSPVSSRRRRSSPYPYDRTESSATSLSGTSPGHAHDNACSVSPTSDRLRSHEDKLSVSPRRDDAYEGGAPDRRLALIEATRIADLMHVDSGFDETMVEELSMTGSQSTAIQPVHRPCTPDQSAATAKEEPAHSYTPSATRPHEDGGIDQKSVRIGGAVTFPDEAPRTKF